MSQLKEFYSGRNVFITGSTGFLGQVLLEKLLRDCPEIGTIYTLIRMKKGKNEKERIDALLAGPLFNQIRSERPNFAEKIALVPGDITQERLGLSASDYERITSEVSVIFHLAATVRFNEKLNVAVTVNVNSVKHIVDIAKACTNLKAGVYVSTAYSHSVRSTINEEVYPAPLSCEAVNKLIDDVMETENPQDELKRVTEKVLNKWPNTYAFTKAIGESVIAEVTDVPLAIFRPSIVIGIHDEPLPGWTASLSGPAGLFAAGYAGLLRTWIIDLNKRADVVPVDYVCNALIACAWETAITERKNNENIPVYNFVSGSENPITWGRYINTANDLNFMYPTNSAIYFILKVITKSRFVFAILNFFLHLIPALIVDNVLRLFGKKPRLRGYVRQFVKVAHALEYFTTQEWTFENRRVQNLWKRLTPEDKKWFTFSMRKVDWDDHCVRTIKGVRKYILGDSDDNLEKAKRRRKYLYVIHIIVCLSLTTFFIWITWKLLQGICTIGNTSSAAV